MATLSAADILDWIEGTAMPGDSPEQLKGRFQELFCEGGTKAGRAELESELRTALTMWVMKQRQTPPKD